MLGNFSHQDVTWTVLLPQSNQLSFNWQWWGSIQNPMCDQSQVTHLWLFDTALLERAAARIVGARVTIFAPVALVWASNTGQTWDREWVWINAVSLSVHKKYTLNHCKYKRYSRLVNAAVVEDKASVGKKLVLSPLIWGRAGQSDGHLRGGGGET